MATAAVEAPTGFPETSMEPDDVVYSCKGCGEILEEGKAFELAGNRWHIECFQCNTCGTLLDSDANLLLLGDGSLICNNCTYSCSACGNKIEDLAILTGDQAFCSGCFRCRNCKRKIENLRYARTSQGIFCMSCHESLMARRRKKAKAASKSASGGPGAEKALPSLPLDADPPVVQSPEAVTPTTTFAEAQTPNPRSPRDRQVKAKSETTSSQHRRDVAPSSEDASKGGSTRAPWLRPMERTDPPADGPTLPASTYKDTRRSGPGSRAHESGPEQGLLPMAFDPTPITRKQFSPSSQENRSPRDYFGEKSSSRSSQKETSADDSRAVSPKPVSAERDVDRAAPSAGVSLHIAFQEKGRGPTNLRRDVQGGTTSGSGSMAASPVVPSSPDRTHLSQSQKLSADSQLRRQDDSVKLQDAPALRSGGYKSDVSPSPASPADGEARSHGPGKVSPMPSDTRQPGAKSYDGIKRKEVNQSGTSPAAPSRSLDRTLPLRGDSLAASLASTQNRHAHERNASVSSMPSSFVDAKTSLSRQNSDGQPPDSPDMQTSLDSVPERSAHRPGPSNKSNAMETPTNNAAPSSLKGDRQQKGSVSQLRTDISNYNVGILRTSADGAFSMEDEMGRILRGERSENSDGISPSVLRRVSNAVKHGRSFSDREAIRGAKPAPLNAPVEVNSPQESTASVVTPTVSNEGSDGVDQLRASLRRAQVQIAELSAEKIALQDTVNSSSEIKAANTELREKRSTMAILDTQREMVVRELEVLTDHLSKAKDSDKPLDLNTLKTTVLKEFAESIQKLKDGMSSQIEDLIHRRNELTEEITNLIQMKDKGFQEYEALSSRNAQLLQQNNDILRGANGAASANGLGIFHVGSKGDGTSDIRNMHMMGSESSGSNLLHDPDDPTAILTTPQVINIRKGGKPNKFNWRKGGESLAKNVTKGIKGAFAERQPAAKEISIGMPYNSVHNPVGGPDGMGLNGKIPDDGRLGSAGGFGLFPQKSGGFKGGMGQFKNNSSVNLADGSVLFGSELSARCEYENRIIPNLVVRCISEVESRGMDTEGIYRKSGGAGQVKTVQQGLEKDKDYDLADPDLEIHAVTSTLKQYLRKLPTPLITYDVYDSLLETGQIQDREKQVVAIKLAVHDLPDAHRDSLQYLIQHLARVMAHESNNLMTPLNLAVVFAPTIMRPMAIEREMTDMQAQRVAVQALLDNHKAVFPAEE